ncbi:MAG TPA: hypothetical protein VIO58_04365 [Candidatus Methanoperedens sp.]
MSFKNFLDEQIYKIASSDKTTRVLAVLQLLATVSGFLYPTYKESKPDVASGLFFSFLFFQIVVLLFFILMLLPGQYRAIKLRLNRNTGVLYDATTNFRNISLRDETLNIIFDNISNGGATYNIGKKVGENFYDSFERELERKGLNLNIEDKLEKWLEYDSSSGIGKFEHFRHSDSLVELKIISPFIGSCPNQKPNQRCCFLLGYIDGFSSKLYGQKLKSTCKHSSDPSYCILTINKVD